jgi:hypothetical protein
LLNIGWVYKIKDRREWEIKWKKNSMTNKSPSNNLKYKRITITVPEELDFKFRSIASKKFKFEKGWYSKAFTESMENWIVNNELAVAENGTTLVSRYLGSKMLEFFKNDDNSKEKPDFNTLNRVFDCFSQSSYVKNIKYELGDDTFTYHIKSPHLSKNGKFNVEDLIGKHTFPLSIISRAFMEDLTGDHYKVKSKRLGKCSKVELGKSKY